MFHIPYKEFENILAEAIDELDKSRKDTIKNIAIIIANYPTEDQRIKLKLQNNETLLGLYEGVPLIKRQGQSKLLPDKITIFQSPIENLSRDLNDLKSQVRHTLWHEIAHYYGLNHDDISKKEQ